MRATQEQAELHASRELCENMEATNGQIYTNQVHCPANHCQLALQSAPDPQNSSSCFAITRQSHQDDRIHLRDLCTQTSSRRARRDTHGTGTPRHPRGSMHPYHGIDSHPRRLSLAHSCAQPRPRKPQSTPTSMGKKAPQRKVSSDTGQRTAGSQHFCSLPKIFQGCRRRWRPERPMGAAEHQT